MIPDDKVKVTADELPDTILSASACFDIPPHFPENAADNIEDASIIVYDQDGGFPMFIHRLAPHNGRVFVRLKDNR